MRENQRVTLTLIDGGNDHPEEDWLDLEYLRACAREADDNLSLEAVRQALAKIPGSLTQDFIAEREGR